MTGFWMVVILSNEFFDLRDNCWQYRLLESVSFYRKKTSYPKRYKKKKKKKKKKLDSY